MPAVVDAPHIEAEDRATWRAWLEANHATASGAWLVTRRAASGRSTLDYEASVEEALCFGWVDSRLGKVDEQRTKLYFAPRRPRSAWSASNKARIARLTAAGLMAPAGIAAVERATSNGTWEALDAAAPAATYWAAFPRSVRQGILDWIALAKRPETRAARVEETARLAARNERANQWRPKA